VGEAFWRLAPSGHCQSYQYSVGLAVTAPLAYAFESGRIEWSNELIYALAYLVLANSLLAVTLLIAMLRRGEASRVSALFFLVPPTAAVLAWAVLGEDMPLAGWIGMALAAFGVALACKNREPMPYCDCRAFSETRKAGT